MRIVVTGGAGALGRLVSTEAESRGHDVRAASRRTGVDLSTGSGVADAVADADAVIHCASNPRKPEPVDVHGTRRLIEALPEGAHLVYISIVGCDQNPFGYYVAKTKVEELLANSGRSVTVVRATQFHDFAAAIARGLSKGPIALSVRNLAFQTVETSWVAQRLVDQATGARPDGFSRVNDLAGPDVLTLPEIAAKIRAQDGRTPPRILTFPAIGGVLKSFATRTNLPGPKVEIGGSTFDEWLSAP